MIVITHKRKYDIIYGIYILYSNVLIIYIKYLV